MADHTEFREDYCERPPEGFSGPDERGHLKYTMYGRIAESAPERDGWDPFFVAVHGSNFTTWTYRPVEERHASTQG